MQKRGVSEKLVVIVIIGICLVALYFLVNNPYTAQVISGNVVSDGGRSGGVVERGISGFSIFEWVSSLFGGGEEVMLQPAPICEATGPGECFYVATDGLDTNAGTFDFPFGTLKRAIQGIGPGDVVYLRGGVYNATQRIDGCGDSGGWGTHNCFAYINNKDGAFQDWIKIKSYPGEKAILDQGMYNEVPTNPNIQIDYSSYFIIEDLELKNGYGANLMDDSNHDMIYRNLEVHGKRGGYELSGGFVVSGPLYNYVIENNLIYDNLWGAGNSMCSMNIVELLLGGSDIEGRGGRNITVRNNLVKNGCTGIRTKHSDSGPLYIYNNTIINMTDNHGGGWGIGTIDWHNVYISRNLIKDVTFGLGKAFWGSPMYTNQNVTYEYNTVYNCAQAGFEFYSGGNVTLRNNIFYECTSNSPGPFSFYSYFNDIPTNPDDIDTDYNCIYHTTSIPYFVGEGWNAQVWDYPYARDNWGYDAHSVMWQNPQILSTTYGSPDFLRPASGSPCIDMGYYAGEAPPAPICEATGSGQCYYIATDGLDTNAGTFDEPFLTLDHAITLIGPGDVVYLRGGTYDATQRIGDCLGGVNNCFAAINNKHGTETDWITIKSYPGEWAILDQGHYCYNGMAMNPCMEIHSSSFMKIESFELKNGHGSTLGGGENHDMIFRDLEIHGTRSVAGSFGEPCVADIKSGFVMGLNGPSSDNYLIENNKIYDNIMGIGGPACAVNVAEIHLGSDDQVTSGNNITIRNNLIMNGCEGIRQKHSGGGPVYIYNNTIINMTWGCGISNIGFDNTYVYRNLLYNVRRGMENGFFSGRGHSKNNLFEYNTIYCRPDSTAGFDFWSGDNLTVRRNIFVNCNGGAEDIRFYTVMTGYVPDNTFVNLSTDENCIYHTTNVNDYVFKDYVKYNYIYARDNWGYDVNSVMWQNPQILSTTYGSPDFLRPASGSPCIDMGYYAGEAPIQTCDEQLGNTCTSTQECDGSWTAASDTSYCCLGTCVDCTDIDGDTYNIEGGVCGLVDCNDTNEYINPGSSQPNCDCVGTPEVSEVGLCTNTIDDDCDGLTDCVDDDCSIDANCVCTDNDGDNYGVGGGCLGTDCDDNNINVWGLVSCNYDGASCGNYNLCLIACPTPPAENCSNTIDDDCDGLGDASDPDCGASTLTTGLEAYYSFDVDANDDTGNGHNGVVTGATHLISSGKLNGAYSFNGPSLSNCINIADFYVPEITISAWVWKDSSYTATGYAGIVSKWDNDYFMGITNGMYSFWLTPGVTIDTSITFPNDVWTHVVMTKNATTFRVYRNGVEFGAPFPVLSSGSIVDGSHIINIGCNDYASSFFGGDIDEVGIWNRALDASEVSQLYNGGVGLNPLESGPECVIDSPDCDYLDGNSCSGTDFMDDNGVCNVGVCEVSSTLNQACDDGAFCNGAETCDSVAGCLAGSNPCLGQSCDEIGDFCYFPCTLDTATWNPTGLVDEGTLMTLEVTGTNCDGETINFEIWEDDLINGEDASDDPVINNPLSVTFSGTTATGTWTAEYQDDVVGNPEYYFIAEVDSNPSETITSASDLQVQEIVAPYCGDLTCNGDEICGDTDNAPECNTDCDVCGTEETIENLTSDNFKFRLYHNTPGEFGVEVYNGTDLLFDNLVMDLSVPFEEYYSDYSDDYIVKKYNGTYFQYKFNVTMNISLAGGDKLTIYSDIRQENPSLSSIALQPTLFDFIIQRDEDMPYRFSPIDFTDMMAMGPVDYTSEWIGNCREIYAPSIGAFSDNLGIVATQIAPDFLNYEQDICLGYKRKLGDNDLVKIHHSFYDTSTDNFGVLNLSSGIPEYFGYIIEPFYLNEVRLNPRIPDADAMKVMSISADHVKEYIFTSESQNTYDINGNVVGYIQPFNNDSADKFVDIGTVATESQFRDSVFEDCGPHPGGISCVSEDGAGGLSQNMIENVTGFSQKGIDIFAYVNIGVLKNSSTELFEKYNGCLAKNSTGDFYINSFFPTSHEIDYRNSTCREWIKNKMVDEYLYYNQDVNRFAGYRFDAIMGEAEVVDNFGNGQRTITEPAFKTFIDYYVYDLFPALKLADPEIKLLVNPPFILQTGDLGDGYGVGDRQAAKEEYPYFHLYDRNLLPYLQMLTNKTLLNIYGRHHDGQRAMVYRLPLPVYEFGNMMFDDREIFLEKTNEIAFEKGGFDVVEETILYPGGNEIIPYNSYELVLLGKLKTTDDGSEYLFIGSFNKNLNFTYSNISSIYFMQGKNITNAVDNSGIKEISAEILADGLIIASPVPLNVVSDNEVNLRVYSYTQEKVNLNIDGTGNLTLEFKELLPSAKYNVTATTNYSSNTNVNGDLLFDIELTEEVFIELVLDSELPQETCSDGIQNQGETGVDCGGPCIACSSDDDSSGDDSSGGGGGPSFPPGNVTTPTNQSQTNITIPEGIECIPGTCNFTSKMHCSDFGYWVEEEYCSYCEDDVCQKDYCGDGICQKYLDEDFRSCMADCKTDLIVPIISAIIIFTIILFNVISIVRSKPKTKFITSKDTKYFNVLKPFLEKAIQKGYKKEQIRKLLLEKKWPKDIVDKALRVL
ncbi:MAG: LamG-like jellyroll fold domain-containing protein [archaeon]